MQEQLAMCENSDSLFHSILNYHVIKNQNIYVIFRETGLFYSYPLEIYTSFLNWPPYQQCKWKEAGDTNHLDPRCRPYYIETSKNNNHAITIFTPYKSFTS